MRPDTKIPQDVTPPYPITHNARVIGGFGRGSSELGIPTANVPVGRLDSLETGIYFGWCRLSQNKDSEAADGHKFNNGSHLTSEDLEVHPMVMSIGWNPFYKNKEKAAEVHILRTFKEDFYGANIKLAILGYVRPELDYTTKDALIADIQMDIRIAQAALQWSSYSVFQFSMFDEAR